MCTCACVHNEFNIVVAVCCMSQTWKCYVTRLDFACMCTLWRQRWRYFLRLCDRDMSTRILDTHHNSLFSTSKVCIFMNNIEMYDLNYFSVEKECFICQRFRFHTLHIISDYPQPSLFYIFFSEIFHAKTVHRFDVLEKWKHINHLKIYVSCEWNW